MTSVTLKGEGWGCENSSVLQAGPVNPYNIINIIARSEVQMETGKEFLNFDLIKNWSLSQERSH